MQTLVPAKPASTPAAPPIRCIGLWCGFPYKQENVQREGITRYCINLAKAMLEASDVRLEIWCYHFNEPAYRRAFAELLENVEYRQRVSILTQRVGGHARQCHLPEHLVMAAGDDGAYLEDVANAHSQADCFLVPHLGIEGGLGLKRPKLLAVHDLFTIEYEELFRREHADFQGNAQIIRTLNAYIRQGALLVSNCDTIRRQVRQRFPELPEAQTSFVYLPVALPNADASSAEEVQPAIDGPYLFLPTQIRPYKNAATVLKALRKLLDAGKDLRLVTTGRLADCRTLPNLVKELKLEGAIREIGSVSEAQLVRLHRQAVATMVPTLSEGGMPWQALEAMYLQTPAVCSRIPVFEERLARHGVDPQNSGLLLFDPLDVDQACAAVCTAMTDRETVVAQQQPVVEALRTYDWRDAARCYLDLMPRAGMPRFCATEFQIRAKRQAYQFIVSLPGVAFARRRWRAYKWGLPAAARSTADT